MQASKIRIALTWAALAGFLLVVLRTVDSATPFVFAFISAVLLSTVIVGVARARRAMARIQELMVLGEPDKMLALVRRKLRYAKRGSPNHAAFTVFLATGLSMKGDWDSALSALADIDPESVPQGDRALWQFGYYNARFACLVFTERLDEARAVLSDNLEPLVEKGTLSNAATALEACRAVMWFCDDEHDRAMEVFARLVVDTPIPAPSRAVFHYFLARIYHAKGVWKGANEHFDEAARLAPKTWVPAGIEAFRESKKLAP